MKKAIDISVLRGPQFYSFSDCYLDTVERRLFKKSKRLQVMPRALEVLQVLVENAGEVVSKEDLLDQIWGESFVEESNLAVQISKLRTALGATKDEPYIVTESGVGYKFVSNLKLVDDDEWADIIENELSKTEDGKQQFTSIAVMPLLNENGKEDMQYLADGVTETLINSLSVNPELRVVARNTVFQFKDQSIDVKKLGRRLRVATILTGRVRIVDGNISIGVELSKVSDGTHMWGTHINESFDDIFEIQDKISEQICSELRLRINRIIEIADKTSREYDFESYRLHLKGKYFVRKGGADNLPKALECFQTALSIDPTNQDAYLDLANCHILMHVYDMTSLQTVRREAPKLLKQASSLSRTNAGILWIKAQILSNIEWNLVASGELYQESLGMKPNSSSCLSSFANLLANVGMFSEAMRFSKHLLRLDPISAKNRISAARILYKSEQYASSIVLLKEAEELDPNSYDNALIQAACYVELEEFSMAIEQFKKAKAIHDGLEAVALEAYIFAREGKIKKAMNLHSKLENLALTTQVPNLYFAYILAGLGEVNAAYARIEQSIEGHEMNILSFRANPMLRHLRSDPRFEETINKLGLNLKISIHGSLWL